MALTVMMLCLPDGGNCQELWSDGNTDDPWNHFQSKNSETNVFSNEKPNRVTNEPTNRGATLCIQKRRMA